MLYRPSRAATWWLASWSGPLPAALGLGQTATVFGFFCSSAEDPAGPFPGVVGRLRRLDDLRRSSVCKGRLGGLGLEIRNQSYPRTVRHDWNLHWQTTRVVVNAT